MNEDTKALFEGSDYEPLEYLGEGRFADVFLARLRQAPDDEPLAVKLLKPIDAFEGGAEFYRRMAELVSHEAGLLEDLAGEGVVGTRGTVTIGDRPALLLEYIPGWALSDLRKEVGRIEPRVALRIIAQVATTLHRLLRDHGILHRDIKGANVRIRPDGGVVVVDFNAAAPAVDGGEAPTVLGIVGTLKTASPERIAAWPFIGGFSEDVYALGAVLFELLVGRAVRRAWDSEPVHRERVAGLLAEVDTALDGSIRPNLRRRVVQLLRGMLHFDPDRRPSMGGVVRVAGQLADELPGPDLERWAADPVEWERSRSRQDPAPPSMSRPDRGGLGWAAAAAIAFGAAMSVAAVVSLLFAGAFVAAMEGPEAGSVSAVAPVAPVAPVASVAPVAAPVLPGDPSPSPPTEEAAIEVDEAPRPPKIAPTAPATEPPAAVPREPVDSCLSADGVMIATVPEALRLNLEADLGAVDGGEGACARPGSLFSVSYGHKTHGPFVALSACRCEVTGSGVICGAGCPPRGLEAGP